MLRAPRSAALALLAVGALTLSACSDDAAPADTASTSSASTSAGTSYPLTLDNCGFETTIDAAPQRVVTIKSSTTEMMLALGLGDRIVGSAFPDGPLPDDLAADAPETVTTPMSDKVPGAEAVYALEPDLVFAGWESNLTGDGAGERDTYEKVGVATYVAPSACKEAGYQPDPLTFDSVFDEITQAGEIFDVPDAAADLVAQQRATLADATPDDRGLTALWYSSGSDTPYVGAGIGAPQMMMDAVGLENVGADVHDTWTSMGWESVVAADPDVIVLVDSVWNSVDDKIAYLEGNPVTAELTAVKHHRFLTVPFAASEAGVRNVDTVVDLQAQLADLDVEG
ncbi:iron complex transport system substrate-binding protein [Sediminihabitans luteus]|uniref:Iron complex transport system substrate-binding protein n=1 Tax=Sediminihabitans luteus TaxID=1138585 RepID=A0A2M9CY81_9CELL|nr:putative F420-0 ABC transporter substrate-binding protein [Sediminihabitans luteus]PJJ76803.1 iron complex transport system substrate-binding protein [Sediminihabitans luteus]GIJ00281.1 ABC transporter substrate-binding protein [Sediminihabitans luteus]